MKKLISSALMIGAMFLTNTSFAQKGDFTIGARGGVNISKLCCGSMELNEDYVFGEGPSFGITAAYNFSNHFSLVAELDYATQGGKRNGMQAITPGSTNILYAKFDNKTVLNYLELPVMARLTMGSKLKYYVNAGPYIGYLLSAKNVTSGSSQVFSDKAGTHVEYSTAQSFEADKDIKSQIKTINFGLCGGIGAGYTFGKHGLWLDSRYVFGMPNIRQNTAVNGENSTGSIMGGIGYTYTIN